MSIKSKVKTIIENYFLCKEQAHMICFSNGQVNRENPFYIFYRDVEIAYYSLNNKEKFYFDNELLTKRTPKWWEPFYTKEEYEEIEKHALRNFMNKFNEIH